MIALKILVFYLTATPLAVLSGLLLLASRPINKLLLKLCSWKDRFQGSPYLTRAEPYAEPPEKPGRKL